MLWFICVYNFEHCNLVQYIYKMSTSCVRVFIACVWCLLLCRQIWADRLQYRTFRVASEQSVEQGYAVAGCAFALKFVLQTFYSYELCILYEYLLKKNISSNKQNTTNITFLLTKIRYEQFSMYNLHNAPDKPCPRAATRRYS